MKKTLFAVIILIMTLSRPEVFAENNIVNGQLEALGLDSMYDAVYSSDSVKSYAGDFDFEETIKKIASGENIFSVQTILTRLFKMLSNEIYANINIILTLIILSVISAIISNLQSSFETKSVAEVSFLACYIMFVSLLVYGFNECASMVKDVLSEQLLFLKASVPTYIGLMMSTGHTTKAVGLQPVFLYFLQLIGSFMESIMFPTTMWICILNMVNNISDKFHVTRLIQFTKQLMTWLLGILMTLFVSILGISGVATSTLDNVGVKTLKYAASNFIPIVGGFLSDSIDTVMASASVLKNSVGIAGIIVLVIICVAPLIKLWVLIGLYKLTAGIIEPVCDKRIVTLISDTASSITFLSLIVISVTIMFVLSVTILIGFGSTMV